MNADTPSRLPARTLVHALVDALAGAFAYTLTIQQQIPANERPEEFLLAAEQLKSLRHALLLGRRYLGEEDPPPEIDPKTLATAREALCRRL